MTRCRSCPRDGAYLCPTCRELLERAGQGTIPLSLPAESERSFQGRLRRAALDLGWRYYHTHDSRGSDEGWPDVALAKPGQPLLLCELKRAGQKPTMAQLTWISLLNTTTRVEAGVYRPADWDLLVAKLSRKGTEWKGT